MSELNIYLEAIKKSTISKLYYDNGKKVDSLYIEFEPEDTTSEIYFRYDVQNIYLYCIQTDCSAGQRSKLSNIQNKSTVSISKWNMVKEDFINKFVPIKLKLPGRSFEYIVGEAFRTNEIDFDFNKSKYVLDERLYADDITLKKIQSKISKVMNFPNEKIHLEFNTYA